MTTAEPFVSRLGRATARLLQAGTEAVQLLEDCDRALGQYSATADPQLAREIAAAAQRWRLASDALSDALQPQEPRP